VNFSLRNGILTNVQKVKEVIFFLASKFYCHLCRMKKLYHPHPSNPNQQQQSSNDERRNFYLVNYDFVRTIF
jgi:hypothetical protein